MFVQFIKDIEQFKKGNVVDIEDLNTVISMYEDGVLVPLIGPDGPSIHEAAPEDVEEVRKKLVSENKPGAKEFKALKINFTEARPISKKLKNNEK